MRLRLGAVAVIVGCVSALGLAARAEVAGKAEGNKDFYYVARNAVGLIHYCVKKGQLDQSAMDKAHEYLSFIVSRTGHLPDGDRYEEVGRQGMTPFNPDRTLKNIDKNPKGIGRWCSEAYEGMQRFLVKQGA